MKVERLFQVLAALLIALPVFAAEEGSLERPLVPRRPLITVQGELPRRQLQMMGALLQSNLLSRSETEPVAFAVAESAVDRAALVEQARRAGADCLIALRIVMQEDRALIRSAFIEFDRAEPLWEGSASINLTAKDLEQSAWAGLVESARARLAPSPQKVIVKEVLVEKGVTQEVKRSVGIPVTVRALPGTMVTGLDREMRSVNMGSSSTPMIQNVEVTIPIEIPESGFFTREVGPGSTFLLRAEKLGYLPVEYPLGIVVSPKDVSLPQRLPSRLELETYTNFRPESGITLLYHLIPGTFFIGAGFSQTFFMPIPPFDPMGFSMTSWWHRNLMTYFELGSWLMPADQYFRIGLGASFNLNFIAPPDKPLRIHPLYPLIFTPNIKLEFNPVKGFSIYARWSPRFIAGWAENPSLYASPGDPFNYVDWSPYTDGMSVAALFRYPGSNYAIDLNPIPYLGFRFSLPY